MKGNIYLLPTYMHLCEYIYLLIDNRYLYKCHVSAPDKNVDICFLAVGFKKMSVWNVVFRNGRVPQNKKSPFLAMASTSSLGPGWPAGLPVVPCMLPRRQRRRIILLPPPGLWPGDCTEVALVNPPQQVYLDANHECKCHHISYLVIMFCTEDFLHKVT